MSRHCAVTGCSNGDYALKKWKDIVCSVHNAKHGEKQCLCEPPFRLIPFPTEKKDAKMRKVWIQMLNRMDPNNKNKFWSPGSSSRICSRHFTSNEHTSQPFPSINLGYDSRKRAENILRQLPKESPLAIAESCLLKKANDFRIEAEITSLVHFTQKEANLMNAVHILPTLWQSYHYFFGLFLFLRNYLSFCVYFAMCNNVSNTERQHDREKVLMQITIKSLANRINLLIRANKLLDEKLKKCTCQQPLHEILLKNDKDVMFYTGIPSKKLFDSLCTYISPFVKRKWRGVKESNINIMIGRKYKRTPQKLGRKSKLGLTDEFLLTLMKIRLGLLGQDLAQRFKISATLTSRIFSTWVKSAASVLDSFVYIPEYGNIAASKPPRFKDVPKLHSIADGTEIFIQTPKNHLAQRQTWSSYKHHNTAKILVVVLPNSHIAFVSKAYSGCISDKELTNKSGYLDLVEPYTSVMVDKGFNILDECAARCINVIVPPGKRGQSQMGDEDVSRTTKIAKYRILVEQVISRFKKFHIISKEVPITLLCHLDDIITICAALCNLKKPIYGK